MQEGDMGAHVKAQKGHRADEKCPGFTPMLCYYHIYLVKEDVIREGSCESPGSSG